jgi:hypothetical protein
MNGRKLDSSKRLAKIASIAWVPHNGIRKYNRTQRPLIFSSRTLSAFSRVPEPGDRHHGSDILFLAPDAARSLRAPHAHFLFAVLWPAILAGKNSSFVGRRYNISW